jgi:hypothetical protein
VGFSGGERGLQMFDYILNQARRAQQQWHLKRGARARQRAIDSISGSDSDDVQSIDSQSEDSLPPEQRTASSPDEPQGDSIPSQEDSFQQNFQSN